MPRSFPWAFALILTSLLVGCSDGPAGDTTPPRRALVVHPQVAPDAAFNFFGQVHARHEPELSFRVAGKIRQRLVSVGDEVEAGQPLATLNAADLELQLDAARASLAAARADRQLAQADLQRYRQLLERQVISQSRFDTAQARYRAAEASFKRARAQLEVARNQRSYATLRAPDDGVIAARMAEAGQVVAAGQPVFRLAVAGEWEVRVAVPEQNVAEIQVGQPVRIALWAHPGEVFPGHVREVAPAADPVSRTYQVRIAFDNDQARAHLGQSARVALQTGESRAPLSIPLSALTADQGQPFVWVVGDDNRLQKTPVEPGPYWRQRVPIRSGLKADDWVVAAGTQLFRAGERVQPVDRENRPLNLASE